MFSCPDYLPHVSKNQNNKKLFFLHIFIHRFSKFVLLFIIIFLHIACKKQNFEKWFWTWLKISCRNFCKNVGNTVMVFMKSIWSDIIFLTVYLQRSLKKTWKKVQKTDSVFTYLVNEYKQPSNDVISKDVLWKHFMQCSCSVTVVKIFQKHLKNLHVLTFIIVNLIQLIRTRRKNKRINAKLISLFVYFLS